MNQIQQNWQEFKYLHYLAVQADVGLNPFLGQGPLAALVVFSHLDNCNLNAILFQKVGIEFS